MSTNFLHFDAVGTNGFSYNENGEDITDADVLEKIRAVYDLDGATTWCSAYVHRNGTESEILLDLQAHLS